MNEKIVRLGIDGHFEWNDINDHSKGVYFVENANISETLDFFVAHEHLSVNLTAKNQIIIDEFKKVLFEAFPFSTAKPSIVIDKIILEDFIKRWEDIINPYDEKKIDKRAIKSVLTELKHLL